MEGFKKGGEGQHKPILPDGSIVRKITEDTKTHIEHGKETWPLRQSLIDILQNHLDANTEIFYEKLVGSVVDLNRLEQMITENPEKAPELTKRLDEFGYMLWRYRKSIKDLTPEAEKNSLRALEFACSQIPILPEILSDGRLKPETIRTAVEAVHEQSPTIKYKIIDSRNDEPARWVTREELASEKMREKIGNKFRYSFNSIVIIDEGSGFDAKLQAFYKSTKTNRPYLRGKYGEGAKLSAIGLTRQGVDVKISSRFRWQDGPDIKERIWQARPTISDKNTVIFKGIEIEYPQTEPGPLGSNTWLDFSKADPALRKEFVQIFDPRRSEKMEICLDYGGDTDYQYPAAIEYNQPSMVGVNVHGDTTKQYVHGLLVPMVPKSFSNPDMIFSYNFLDSSVLGGRDRNSFKKERVEEIIVNFWKHAESPALLEALIRQLFLSPQFRYGLEVKAFFDIFNNYPYDGSPQAKRVYRLVFELLPKVLGLKRDRKNVFFSNAALETPANRAAEIVAREKNYNPIIISTHWPKNAPKFIGYYEVLVAEELVEKKAVEPKELPEHDREVKTINRIFSEALASATESIHRSGTDLEIKVRPRCIRQRTDEQEYSSDPYMVWYEPSKNEYVIDIIIREIFLRKNIIHEDYWKRRFEVLFLGLAGQRKQIDKAQILNNSQYIANEALRNSLSLDDPDFATASSISFHHDKQPDVNLNSELDKFSPDKIREMKRISKLYEQLLRYDCTIEELRQVVADTQTLDPYYRKIIEKRLGQKYIVENDLVAYCLVDKKNNIALQVDRLEDLPIEMADGEKAYKLKNGRYIVPRKIPENTIVQIYNKAFIIYKGVMYRTEHGSLDLGESDSAIKLGKNCFVFSIYGKEGVTELLKMCKVVEPENGVIPELRKTEETIETSLPLEYGVDEWDEKRVCTDIIQNHRDAGTVSVRYEIFDGEERRWVSENEIKSSDTITGLQISDDGTGYAPEDIGTLGKKSKHSPFFAGKYGEGQKMIAAAAARNGLELSFSSVASYDKKPYRWEAKVTTKEINLIIHGKRTQEKKVAFNITSEPLQHQPYTSATIIRLPEGREPDTQWQQWVRTISPLESDRYGHNGLGRFFIDFRPQTKEKIIDMGAYRILLDEPGAVYENGLLINRIPGRSVVGYDVPAVTDTRERNSINEHNLNSYIQLALVYCQDPRYAQKLIHAIKNKYLNDFVDNHQPPAMELDLKHIGNYSFGEPFFPSEPFFREAYRLELGDYRLCCTKELQRIIKEEGYDPKNTMKAQIGLENLSHLPAELRLNLGSELYRKWGKFFPTEVDHALALSEASVAATSDTIKKLKRIVNQSAKAIKKLIADLQSREDTKLSYLSIICGTNPNNLREGTFRIYGKQKKSTAVKEKAGYWARPQKEDTVFVAPGNVGYLGLAAEKKIGLSQNILDNPKTLTQVIRHELVHKIFGLRDYNENFIMLLIELARNGKTK